MPRPNDSHRSLLPLEQESTLIAVVELSRSSWLVAGVVPGLERHPLKKLEPDEDALLRLLHRWRDEAARAGTRDHPPRGRLRGRPGRLLAGALAAGA